MPRLDCAFVTCVVQVPGDIVTFWGVRTPLPTILHHPLVCLFVWAAAKSQETVSDGTLSIRRVGCRGHGIGTLGMGEGIYSLHRV